MRDTEIYFLFCLDHHILRGFSFTLLLREHKSKRTLSFWRSPDRYRNEKTTNEYRKVPRFPLGIHQDFSFTLLLCEHKKSKRSLIFWISPDRYRNGKTTNEYSKVSCSIGQNSTVQNKTAHPRTAEGITVCNVQYNSVESSTLIFNSG